MDNPLVSVIIPVYNVEKYLGACMTCVCNQTYKNIEIIMVDDGAKDSSGSMCDSWKKEDNRIRVIHKKNGGLSDARNAGITLATGEYIVFIDSDDLVSEKLVEHLYNTMIKYHAHISICDLVHCYPDKEFSYFDETKSLVYNAEDAICEMMYQTSFLYAAGAKMYRRELFDSINFPVGLLYEDVAIMYKVFANADAIAYSDAKLYGYLHRENSITTKKFNRRDCDIINICNEQLTFAIKYSPKVYKAAQAYQVVGALRIYLNAPNTDEFCDDIKKCEELIRLNGPVVAKDPRCRRKLKLSLILFRLNKRLLRSIYARVDRWK